MIGSNRPNWIRLFTTLLALCAVAAAPSVSLAQNLISASPDVTINLGGGVIAADHDVSLDNQLGIVLLENLGPLPDSAEVIALGGDVNGDHLLAFEATTQLSGGVVARPGDVVRHDGVAYSIVFEATTAGLPSSVATDAASLSAAGLILEYDASAANNAWAAADLNAVFVPEPAATAPLAAGGILLFALGRSRRRFGHLPVD